LGPAPITSNGGGPPLHIMVARHDDRGRQAAERLYEHQRALEFAVPRALRNVTGNGHGTRRQIRGEPLETGDLFEIDVMTEMEIRTLKNCDVRHHTTRTRYVSVAVPLAGTVTVKTVRVEDFFWAGTELSITDHSPV